MTDEERMNAFTACVNEKRGPVNKAGLNFIANVITGNFGGAIFSWVRMVTAGGDTSECKKFLTPEQLEFLKVEAAKYHEQWLQRKDDDMARRGKGI